MRLLFVAILAVVAGGCVISEQIGDMGGLQGNDQAVLVFHFGTDFNKALVLGRSLLLVGLAVWVFVAESGGRRVMTFLVGLPAILAASFLLAKDFPRLKDFRLEVRPAGLTLHVPPSPRKEIRWTEIEGMRVEGFEWQRGTRDPFGKKQLFGELPEWKTMYLTLAGGESYTMDLEALSVEQRGTFFRAIAKYAALVEQ